MVLKLRDGARVTVSDSGAVEYRTRAGRVFRRPSVGSYAETVALVRGNAFGSDVRYVTEK